jgi:hypothetical protein
MPRLAIIEFELTLVWYGMNPTGIHNPSYDAKYDEHKQQKTPTKLITIEG